MTIGAQGEWHGGKASHIQAHLVEMESHSNTNLSQSTSAREQKWGGNNPMRGRGILGSANARCTALNGGATASSDQRKPRGQRSVIAPSST